MARHTLALVGFVLAMVPAMAGAQPFQVRMGPPPMRMEVRTPRPSPAHQWLAGAWVSDGTRNVWSPGRWEVPPQPNQMWRAPQWNRHGQGYRFTPGQWAMPGGNLDGRPMPPPGNVPMAVETGHGAMMAPPPMRHENRPRVTPPGQAWVGGYWNWNGTRHEWSAGHFEAPPSQQQHSWSAPRWRRQGQRWNLTPGRWH